MQVLFSRLNCYYVQITFVLKNQDQQLKVPNLLLKTKLLEAFSRESELIYVYLD